MGSSIRSVCRVLIVDDSATMRRLIRQGLEGDPRLQVVGEAASAKEARDRVKEFEPDIMTLDVEMPGMDGLEFLKRLMLARPMPVVMVSSLTGKGTEAAVSALSLGALECFEKPRFGAARDTFARLADVLVDLSSASPKSRGTIRHGVSRTAVARERRWNGKKVLIGSSTGGVEALETIFADFPHDCPPTLVTQHMPAPFLSSFATRLNANVQPAVRLARDGDRVVEGEILIAPGGDCHMVVDPAGDVLRLRPGAKRSGHRPSVDLLFLSAVPQAKDFVAALLTGMGRDGAEGMAALRAEGAKTIAQDENSCVVYGMPRVAHMLGGVERTVPLARIASELLDATTDESREVQGNE